MYTIHAIGVTTGRNTGVNTDQPVYTHFTLLAQTHTAHPAGMDLHQFYDAAWPNLYYMAFVRLLTG